MAIGIPLDHYSLALCFAAHDRHAFDRDEQTQCDPAIRLTRVEATTERHGAHQTGTGTRHKWGGGRSHVQPQQPDRTKQEVESRAARDCRDVHATFLLQSGDSAGGATGKLHALLVFTRACYQLPLVCHLLTRQDRTGQEKN